MSVFSRFSRWIRSVFGGAISRMEDPKLILEQNIRELNDQVPKMNENIATVKANVLMLEKEQRRNTKEVQSLTSKIRAAIQAGRDDIATQYAMRLEKAKEQHVRLKEQLAHASAAYDKALQVKKTFMREKERKIEEAKHAMRQHEQAQWQARVADTLEQFEVSGIDQTHDEMLRRLQEETARNEARMELALDSVDTQAMQIEEDAETLRAEELVRQFKLEMGDTQEGEQEPAEPARIHRLETEDEETSEGRTLGRQRSRTE